MSWQRCESCEHLMTTDIDKDLKRKTVCMRYPPVVHILSTPQGTASIVHSRPIINDPKSEWCGEYKGE